MCGDSLSDLGFPKASHSAAGWFVCFLSGMPPPIRIPPFSEILGLPTCFKAGKRAITADIELSLAEAYLDGPVNLVVAICVARDQ